MTGGAGGFDESPGRANQPIILRLAQSGPHRTRVCAIIPKAKPNIVACEWNSITSANLDAVHCPANESLVFGFDALYRLISEDVTKGLLVAHGFCFSTQFFPRGPQ